MGARPQVGVRPSSAIVAPRGFRPENFVAPTGSYGHVLLLDDTWASGGHAQSTAAALKEAGADKVTTLVLARWLAPEWGDTTSFISTLAEDFDPDVCPLTGRRC